MGSLEARGRAATAAIERELCERLLEPPLRLETALRAVNGPWLQRANRAVTGAALRLPPVRRALAGWATDALGEPAACCEADSCHFRFIERYFALGAHPSRRRFVERYLGALPHRRRVVLLEALGRIGFLSMVRHGALRWRREQLGRTAPAVVEVQLAPYPDCPLACHGCYGAQDRAGRAPDRAALTSLVDQAAACGAMAIHIVGKGEPLLAWERAATLVDVVAAHPHLLFIIATNGHYFPPALARRFAAVGNALLLVSVEGDQQVHDGRRGTGSFAAARRTLGVMKEHHLLYGFVSMVSQRSYRAVTDPEFLREQAAAGCALGVLSRYFPLSPSYADELALRPDALRDYERRLAAAQRAGWLPLADLDEVESYTGCRSRSGTLLYVDGVRAAAAPCVRAPFAPPECTFGAATGRQLSDVLEGPFFTRYRRPGGSPVPWCGADLAAELASVASDCAACGAHSAELERYQRRCARLAAAGPSHGFASPLATSTASMEIAP